LARASAVRGTGGLAQSLWANRAWMPHRHRGLWGV